MSVSSKTYAGQWEWSGEDFAIATCRETKEETGLDIQLVSFADAVDFSVGQFRVIAFCIKAKVRTGELKLSDEHDAYTLRC